jgi:(S)-2-hydroxyglutarate dehydrogenase
LKKVAILGGGIIGLALGYKLSLEGIRVSIFEKENQLGLHQSGRNSGVLHCGLYYQPGSLKAKLSVNGIREMIDFCKKHDIQHDVCGKVVVATTDIEVQALDQLAARGNKNGLEGLRYLSAEALKLREPFVRAIKALLVPEEGIVDYKAVMHKMADMILQNHGEIHYNTSKLNVKRESQDKIVINCNNEEKEFDQLVSCSGLWSDRNFTKFTHKKAPLKIVPFRGEYLKFKKGYEDRVNHLVYPVPDAQFPFLGVHFTRMIDGSREVGPNAVLALKREGYSKTSFSFKDSFESLTYPGLLRFVGKNFSFSVNEFKSSLFMKDFIAKAQKMIPDVDASMLETGPAGVRAQAISKEGQLQMDFNIIREGRQIHVLNAPSPGATASLAIADHIIKNYLQAK